ncbi:hypothetical protein PSENEW3n2_00003822 [Picochlorum sp. SENEW3]|nr:hypothetical protein PSENEW3n2_00003822 [Picochlorum sp. SENEW3]WPT18522.1 hypothetical protein PSENEW3_00003822 [Picochlorum sp. SENEW3]
MPGATESPEPREGVLNSLVFLQTEWSRLQPFLLAVVVISCSVWVSGTRKLHHDIRMHLIPSNLAYRPHFPGRQGRAALDKLIRWNDELFMSTMTVYKQKAQDLCRNDTAECSVAASKRRPPEPLGFKKYDLFNPYIECPDGSALQRVGDDGDGGKWICTEIVKKKDCVVFSLGSNGQYGFEKDLLESTECDIFTFDCTYDGVSQGTRHTYVQKCIGTAPKESSNPSFTTLAHAVRDLGVSTIDLLKIDIEGYEFDETAYWSIKDPWLPEQIAIEVHHSQAIYSGKAANTDFSNLLWPAHDLYLSDLALFFGHLGHLGYAIASREDNPFGTCCAEFLLVRVADWT